MKITDYGKKRRENLSKEAIELELNKFFPALPDRPELFIEALTHASYAHEKKEANNEKLEFLGDSVLSLIVSHFLFEAFPNQNEGYLAKLKATIVSTAILAKFARQMKLDLLVRLGYGELCTKGNLKPKILEDAFEAFLGAYYLNFGLRACGDLVLPLIKADLNYIMAKLDKLNAKTNLQELVQGYGLKLEYRLVKEEGPPHHRYFTVEVIVNRVVYGCGSGFSMKEAQNNAAEAAIQTLKTNFPKNN